MRWYRNVSTHRDRERERANKLYTYVRLCVCTYIHLYKLHMHMHIHLHIHVHVYVYIYILLHGFRSVETWLRSLRILYSARYSAVSVQVAAGEDYTQLCGATTSYPVSTANSSAQGSVAFRPYPAWDESSALSPGIARR